MAYRKNTALRNALANSFASQFGGGSLRIYTGSQPANGNDAPTGTLLVTITLPASPFTTASSGVVSKAGTWSAVATATGTAGWARMISSSGLVNADFSVAESAADIIIDDDAITSGAAVSVTAFSMTEQAG
jgi:hypothetical protein